MAEVNDWSTSAASNTSLFPNGMQVAQTNDSAREMQAAMARWEHDLAGRLATAGTGAAYTLTTYRTITTLDTGFIVVARAHVANTGAATLSVNGMTAKPLARQSGTDLQVGDITLQQKLFIVWNEAMDRYCLIGVGDAASETDLPEYAKAALPAVTSKKMIIVTDEVGGRVPAFADGTNWRRVTDRAIVS